MEEECLTALHDCNAEKILRIIENHPSGLGLTATDVLKKIAYFDPSYGVNVELSYLLISECTSDSFENSNVKEEQAKKVLKVLQDHKLIYEKSKKNPNCSSSFQLHPGLQEKLLIHNGQDLSVIIGLIRTFQKNFTDCSSTHLIMCHALHIHKSLKHLRWPDHTIKWSVDFGVQLLVDGYNIEMGSEMIDDATEFLTTVNFSDPMNEAYWIAIQMARIYRDTIMNSRKLLLPSDMISVRFFDGTVQDIRLDNYASWILNQVRCYTESDAIISLAVATLGRLQKHEKFCSKPDESTLNWIICYGGNDWHDLNSYAALACFSSTDGWLEKMCRAYIRKLFEKMERYGHSDYSLQNVYLSWVCLRDLVKKSRIRDQIISALTDEDGLQFLFTNFKKCESSLESKEYFLKYQGQTVIEMLAPLLVHGKLEDVQKLLKCQEFWNFVILVLVKHPFIQERYNLTLENDLVCACEVYLDMLIALCKRNHDAIPQGYLRSFLSQDFLTTFAIVIKAAGRLLETRQRHTCKFYLFTILFTLFDNLNDLELADIYFNNEDIYNEVEELTQTNFIFDVPDGCLREYRKHLKNFIDLYRIKTKTTNSEALSSVVQLIQYMTTVPEKYEWETLSDEIES